MRVKDLIYLLQTRGNLEEELLFTIFLDKGPKGILEVSCETLDADFTMVGSRDGATTLFLPLDFTNEIQKGMKEK